MPKGDLSGYHSLYGQGATTGEELAPDGASFTGCVQDTVMFFNDISA